MKRESHATRGQHTAQEVFSIFVGPAHPLGGQFWGLNEPLPRLQTDCLRADLTGLHGSRGGALLLRRCLHLGELHCGAGVLRRVPIVGLCVIVVSRGPLPNYLVHPNVPNVPYPPSFFWHPHFCLISDSPLSVVAICFHKFVMVGCRAFFECQKAQPAGIMKYVF